MPLCLLVGALILLLLTLLEGTLCLIQRYRLRRILAVVWRAQLSADFSICRRHICRCWMFMFKLFAWPTVYGHRWSLLQILPATVCQVFLVAEVGVALGVARVDFLDVLLLLGGVDHILILSYWVGLLLPHWWTYQRCWLFLWHLSC